MLYAESSRIKVRNRITAVVISPDPTDNQNSSTVGELLPNCEAKVMAPDGSRELGENKDGELWIRSPNVAQGYFLEPRLTAQTFLPDGWLRTGDLGHYDAKLNWYVKDRIQVSTLWYILYSQKHFAWETNSLAGRHVCRER